MAMMMRISGFLRSSPELIIWTVAMVSLFFLNPDGLGFTFCPLHNLGFDFCPGCGLGHSVHYAMHMDFKASWAHHPLGFFALIMIIYRIIQLIIHHRTLSNYETESATSDPRR